MDTNHPIPQDVTGFQFRLIGDMTVKQFAYVAVGGILALVALYAPVPIIIRIPFIILFGGAGAAVAFLPIEGRPMDLMISNFFKALLSPNQYLYQKTGGVLPAIEPEPIKQSVAALPLSQKPNINAVSTGQKHQQLEQYLTASHSSHTSAVDKKEDLFLQSIFQGGPSGAVAHVQTNQIPSPPVQTRTQHPTVSQEPIEAPKRVDMTQTPEEKDTSLKLQEQVLTKELADTRTNETIQTDMARKQQVHLHAQELEKQLQEIQLQKEALEKQLITLRQTVLPPQSVPALQGSSAGTQPAQIQAPVSQPSQKEPEAAIRKIPSEMAKNFGLPNAPEAPNLILGIVRDPRGNVLSNILVEVKDKDGTPARAFRTNQLGKFASATPLTNGTYTVEFEDPKGEHQFDLLEIEAKGEILMPIEVISHDAREELRKALFN